MTYCFVNCSSGSWWQHSSAVATFKDNQRILKLNEKNNNDDEIHTAHYIT